MEFTQTCYKLAKRTVPAYSNKFSKKVYTLRQHAVLLCLKVRNKETYRKLVDEITEMPRIREVINLDKIPDHSPLCKAFDRIQMAVWRVLLNCSLESIPVSGITGIDASGFERSHASRHYTKRTELKIQQLKVTLLVDTESNAVLDLYVTTMSKHNSKIAPGLIKRNKESMVFYRLSKVMMINRSGNSVVRRI